MPAQLAAQLSGVAQGQQIGAQLTALGQVCGTRFGTRYVWQQQEWPSPAELLGTLEASRYHWRTMAGAQWQFAQRKTWLVPSGSVRNARLACRQAKVVCCTWDGWEQLLLPAAAADRALWREVWTGSLSTVRPRQSQAGQPHWAVRLHVQHHPTRSCRPHSRPIGRQRQRVHRIP